jgi:integrase
MPLLGLYTGARLNELAKCEVGDFHDYDGIMGIHIRGTKNKASKTWIALHPDLVESGLLEYVEFIKQQGHTMLFPYLNKNKKGYGKTASDAFQVYLKKLDIKQKSQDEPKKGFHSFRDTVNVTIQNCKTWHCDSELRHAYLRHTHHSVNLQFYGAKFAVHKLASQAIPALSYPITVPYFHDYLGSFDDIANQLHVLQKQHALLKKSKAHMQKTKVKK